MESNFTLDMLGENISTFNFDFEAVPENSIYRTPLIVYSVLLYVGICTNIWLLWRLYKSWQTGSRTQFYILALSVSDILALCLRLGVDIGWTATVVWQAGNIGCKVFNAARMFGIALAHYILVAFNVDNAITAALTSAKKAAQVLLVFCAVMAALCTCIPQAYIHELLTVDAVVGNLKYCVADVEKMRGFTYALLFDSAIFWLPLALIALFGIPALIFWCTKRGKASYEVMKPGSQAYDVRTLGSDICLVSFYDILFLICWLPVSLIGLMELLQIDYVYGGMSLEVYYVTNYVAIANSCLNPIVYAFHSCCNQKKGEASSGLEPSPRLP